MENNNKKTALRKASFNILTRKNGQDEAIAVSGYTFFYNGLKFGIYNYKKQETEINPGNAKNKYIIIELQTGLSIAKEIQFLKDFDVKKIFENNHFEKCVEAIEKMKQQYKIKNFEYYKKLVNNYLG